MPLSATNGIATVFPSDTGLVVPPKRRDPRSRPRSAIPARDLVQIDRLVIQLCVDALLECDLARGPSAGGGLADDRGALVVADGAVESGRDGERPSRRGGDA